MPYQIMCRTYVCLIVTCIMMTYGCARTPQARFYILQPQPPAVDQAQLSVSVNDMIIGVGPVELPEHLDRPQIVTRISSNELHLSEFNRWAESLEKNLSRVLAENLSLLLSTDNILVYPWAGSIKVEKQVEVNIIQFDGLPGGEVLLKAHWSLMGEDGKNLLLMKTSSFSAPAGQGYPEMVEAMNRVLADLSREIATAIKDMPPNRRLSP
jgi:uncharacterized lipoprotein YmbA